MDLQGKRDARDDEGHQTPQIKMKLTNFNTSKNLESYKTVIGSKLDKDFQQVKLQMIYTNADCLTNKRTELKLFLNSLNFKPSVISVTKVNAKKSKNKMQESEFTLDGYNLFCSHVGDEKYRGILMYVDNNLQSSQMEINSEYKKVY